MGKNPDDLILIIEQAIQKVLQSNQNTTNYYKNKNKHKNCSKCSILITTENYKKNVDKQVRSRKQNSSRKQDSSNKQVRSRKQNSSINIKNVDPDCLMEKFSELYNNKYDSMEQSQAAREHGKEILNELLRVKAITKRQFNTLYKMCNQN